MSDQSIAVIGAGPGGLAAAALLQKRGFRVDIYESLGRVGGRNGALKRDGFTFDIGPTFFMIPFILEEIFRDLNLRLSDYLKLQMIDPLYHLTFGDDSTIAPSSSPTRMLSELSRFSDHDARAYGDYFKAQEKKFAAIFPCLMRPYPSLLSYLKPYTIRAARYLRPNVSVYDEIAESFENEAVRLSLSFQAKYLGMSPFDCPSIFTILNFIEHRYGVWHPVGGCNRISAALAEVFEAEGGRLHLSSPVEEIEVEQNRVVAIKVKGERLKYDHYVLNADFPEAMRRLIKKEARTRYSDAALERKKYSCSTFMLYLGVKGRVDLPHHSFYFARNLRGNLAQVKSGVAPPRDASIYVHNPSVTDNSLAPAGHSAIYLLIPSPNLLTASNWTEWREEYRNRALELLRERAGVDLTGRIVCEEMITPADWQQEYGVYEGATFGMAHSLDQMLYFRPHNRLQELGNVYLVGGGTHPGSGLPTILQSARIAADLISGASERIRDLIDPRRRSINFDSEYCQYRLR